MLVNVFHGYSHLVNGVVFFCTVTAIRYSEWLFDRIQDKRHNDIQARPDSSLQSKVF